MSLAPPPLKSEISLKQGDKQTKGQKAQTNDIIYISKFRDGGGTWSLFMGIIFYIFHYVF